MDEVPVNMALAAEALAAGVGVLSEDPISEGDKVVAAKLPKKWAAAAKAFMEEDAAEPTPSPAVDAEKVLEKLTAPVESLERVRANISDPTLGQMVLDVIVNARNVLAGQWPTVVLAQAWGPELLEASPNEKRRAAALLRVVDEPSEILTEMLSRNLEPAQAAIFRLCYPTLAQMLDDMLWDHVSALSAKKRLAWSREQTLRIYWNVPPQKQIETPRGTPRAAAGAAMDTRKLQTKAQRLTG